MERNNESKNENKQNVKLPPPDSEFYNELDDDEYEFIPTENTYATPLYIQTQNKIFAPLHNRYKSLIQRNYTQIPRATNLLDLAEFNKDCLDKYMECLSAYYSDDNHAKLDIYLKAISISRKFAINKFISLLKLDINKFVEEEKQENLFKKCNDLRDELMLFFYDFLIEGNAKYDIELLKDIYTSCYKISNTISNSINIINQATKLAIYGLKNNNKKLLGIIDLVLKYNISGKEIVQPGTLDLGEGFLFWMSRHFDFMDKLYRYNMQ